MFRLWKKFLSIKSIWFGIIVLRSASILLLNISKEMRKEKGLAEKDITMFMNTIRMIMWLKGSFTTLNRAIGVVYL